MSQNQKRKKQDDQDQIELPVDLTYCFQSNIILNEMIKKLEYIGTYTVSNCKGAMSKMIGSQIIQNYKIKKDLKSNLIHL